MRQKALQSNLEDDEAALILARCCITRYVYKVYLNSNGQAPLLFFHLNIYTYKVRYRQKHTDKERKKET